MTTTTTRVAVTPYVLSNGAIPSLLEFAPQDQITISGNGPKSLPSVASVVSFDEQNINAAGAMSLGFEGLVDFNVGARASYLLLELKVLANPVPGAPGTIIANEYYGVGFRICVKAWDLDTKTNVSIASVSADCTINGASSAIQMQVVGISPQVLAQYVPLFSGYIGSFDMSTLQDIGVIAKGLQDYISDNYESITPVLMEVDLDQEAIVGPFNLSPSTVYGLHGIYTPDSYNNAVGKDLPSDTNGYTLDDDVIKAMYQVIVGTNYSTKPDDDQQLVARKSVFRHE